MKHIQKKHSLKSICLPIQYKQHGFLNNTDIIAKYQEINII